MQNQVKPITPLSSRYTLWPSAGLAAAALLFMLVWANTCNRRTTTHSVAHSPSHADTHAQGGGGHAQTAPDHEADPNDWLHNDQPADALLDRLRPIDELITQLQSEDSEDRKRAADALAHHSPYAVMPLLKPWVDQQLADGALDDGKAADVLRVYRAWGVVDPALIELAIGSNPNTTRALGVRALGEAWGRVPRRYALLTAAADDASADVRREVLYVCTIADNAQAAGIAQLTRAHPMDPALSDIYDATMQQLARHGPPIPAASRRQRLAAMSYDELLNEPRDEDVLNALLLHPDLPAEMFEPTLQEAAALSGNPPAGQLCTILTDMTHAQLQDNPAPGLALAHRPTAELAEHLVLLQHMAKDDRFPASLYAAAAVARVMIQDDQPATLADARQTIGDAPLLASIALIPEPAVRDRLHPLANATLAADASTRTTPDAAKTYILAIRALPHIPATADTLFETLAAIAREDPDNAFRFTAIGVLADIPPADWPAGHDDLVLTRVTLRTVPNQMAYDPKAFTVTAGRPVVVELINPDTMEHNLVIAAPGKLTDVGLDAALLGDTGGPDGTFVPDSPNVLHYTPMVKPGETATLQFIAPDTPGDYPFVCTYPSHWTTMNGVMHVAAP